jgi:CMP-N,N'-diacetyllegionaminic acid synthase
MTRDTIAIVTARGGSKGLPGKNLRMLAGKPLLAWSIEAGLQSARVTRVVVSSDDAAILACAERFGAVPLLRPSALAQDDTPSEPVLVHALQALAATEPRVLLLQPTSPLRTAEDVDAALAHMDATGADAVISVFEPPHSPWKAFYVDGDGALRGVVSDEAPFRPRQSFPRAAMPNGAIYACRTADFLATGRLFGPRTVPWFMPAARSVDIDTEAELEEAGRSLALRDPI